VRADRFFVSVVCVARRGFSHCALRIAWSAHRFHVSFALVLLYRRIHPCVCTAWCSVPWVQRAAASPSIQFLPRPVPFFFPMTRPPLPSPPLLSPLADTGQMHYFCSIALPVCLGGGWGLRGEGPYGTPPHPHAMSVILPLTSICLFVRPPPGCLPVRPGVCVCCSCAMVCVVCVRE